VQASTLVLLSEVARLHANDTAGFAVLWTAADSFVSSRLSSCTPSSLAQLAATGWLRAAGAFAQARHAEASYGDGPNAASLALLPAALHAVRCVASSCCVVSTCRRQTHALQAAL
jgi:hypothetical protein